MKRLLTFACALGMASLLQAEYLLPETISLTPDGKALIIGEKGAGKVSIRDFSGKELASYDADIAPWWTFGLGDNSTLQVTGATMSPDGSDLFYTADNGNEGRLFNKAGDSVVTGNCPMTPTERPRYPSGFSIRTKTPVRLRASRTPSLTRLFTARSIVALPAFSRRQSADCAGIRSPSCRFLSQI